ncbi:MAG: cytochrome c biogenesis protein CcdA [Alphaproteobacteria bacterium]
MGPVIVMEFGVLNLVVIPAALGLLGFIEPCSIGSSLIFVKYLEGKESARKLAETMLFAATRALFIGALGILAVVLGTAFLGLQQGAWILLGAVYVAIGVAYASGRARGLMLSIGPSLGKLAGRHGSVSLGMLFGLNIPACAAPLLLVLLGGAAAGGATGATLIGGFVSLAVFGLALSLPLVLAVLFAPARAALDWLAGLSGRIPLWTGVVLVVLGLWSIGFGLFVTPEPA